MNEKQIEMLNSILSAYAVRVSCGSHSKIDVIREIEHLFFSTKEVTEIPICCADNSVHYDLGDRI